jgi:hypothetical protein
MKDEDISVKDSSLFGISGSVQLVHPFNSIHFFLKLGQMDGSALDPPKRFMLSTVARDSRDWSSSIAGQRANRTEVMSKGRFALTLSLMSLRCFSRPFMTGRPANRRKRQTGNHPQSSAVRRAPIPMGPLFSSPILIEDGMRNMIKIECRWISIYA